MIASLRLWLAALVIAGFGASAAALEAGADGWSGGKLARARLLAGGWRDGRYLAGVEIALSPGAHTYWRNPGDAGAPPTFDFSGSANVGAASVRYPAPRRIVEDGADVFGYTNTVVLPIDVSPLDAGLPVTLGLNLQYAACARICVPESANLRLTLDRGEAAANADRIDAALTLVPRPLADGGPRMRAERLAATGKGVWKLAIDPPLSSDGDVFSIPPENWFFLTARTPDGAFQLTLDQAPAEAPPAIDLPIVIRDGAHAYETSLHLDVSAATP